MKFTLSRGVAGMAVYRAYRVKQKHIAEPPRMIVADNDRQAIEQAKHFVDGCEVELWEGSRLVISLKSNDSAKAMASRRQKIIDDLKKMRASN
jgi:hypothetical protein